VAGGLRPVFVMQIRDFIFAQSFVLEAYAKAPIGSHSGSTFGSCLSTSLTSLCTRLGSITAW